MWRSSAGRLVATAVAVLVTGQPVQSQSPQLLVQVGPAGGTGEFAGVGASFALEQQLPASIRATARWTNWQALASCSVADAPSECNASAHLWEVGLRYGIRTTEGFTPLFGAGIGIYRRRPPAPQDATNSIAASASAGMDFGLGASTSIRLSLVFQHVFNDQLAMIYENDVEVFGLLVGVGLPLW